jgi:hypothetical protein
LVRRPLYFLPSTVQDEFQEWRSSISQKDERASSRFCSFFISRFVSPSFTLSANKRSRLDVTEATNSSSPCRAKGAPLICKALPMCSTGGNAPAGN